MSLSTWMKNGAHATVTQSKNFVFKKYVRVSWKKSTFTESEHNMCKNVNLNTLILLMMMNILWPSLWRSQKVRNPRNESMLSLQVTNFPLYFHNEMYYYNRETLLRITLVFWQETLLFQVMALVKGFRETFHLFSYNPIFYDK